MSDPSCERLHGIGGKLPLVGAAAIQNMPDLVESKAEQRI